MQPPVAVMFDWCNTIVKTDKLDFAILSRVLTSMNLPHIDLSDIPSNKVELYLSCALGYRWKEAVNMYEKIAGMNINARSMSPNENVLELLEFLSHHKINMGIVSNKRGPNLRNEVQNLGLGKYFSVILGSGDTAENKPSPEPIFAALDIMGIAPSERVFFVGDSDSDIESAKRARCVPIAYDNTSIEGVLSFANFKDLGNFMANLLC
ncbi:HAD family hydrolase [Anaplasma phagocytophilum]|uniref:phosphoglycolate phosphatase n=7 Tax=Anaplasma phagocytophilum TaxID=948 RepID=A0A098EGH4_ANAPH|nr:HAD-IA family hydrolase [Anaplasma phagocytophilum]KJV63852.1 HAD hydrolase, IA, variant 1 family protein [Anaplasma phagocytophilum str. ApMUC09]KJV66445.1 HAD hydrolase, IA, variant 1 family protein [Anaplasma phagocytophilum str. ApNP]ABD43552.1 HAD-superfamily hydrolase, subfamily IA, variant 1 [Anaplasma phagocytophilum str. HZ]AGR78649.1 HAD family hydrolase [Anaplasma phagocytophilum str. HZ2]AGR79896.1 HAD family hydrolase [Anaplasma phagocytophilum str. JM]